MLKKLTWGHGIVIALGSFMAFILFLILIFPIGKQNADLISHNYYDEELVYQDVIDSKNRANTLVEKPVYQQNVHGILIAFPKERIVDDKTVNFVLFRTDDSTLDLKKEDKLDVHNNLNIPAKVLVPGSYTLKLKWEENKKSYQIDYDVIWK